MAMYPCLSLPSLSFPTLTGSIVTFNSQYAGLPLKSHKIALTATQSGSGTPSPVNVRTINGYNNISICNWGANIPNIVFTNNLTILTDGTVTSNPDHQVSDFVDISNITSGYVVMQSPTLNWRNNGLYTAFARIAFYDDNEDFISLDEKQSVTLFYTSIPTGAKYARFMCGGKATDIVISGAIAATITIGSTVYGGEYDARTGVLTVTHGYIASYNGETINEPWISSMDEYVEGGTPSIGAQVVYLLATPQTIQLPPCPIDTLEGVNNIWSDVGNTTLQYPKFG